MKGSIFAAAAIVGSALADGNMHRRHDAFHNRRAVAGGAESSPVSSPASIAPSSPVSSAPALSEESCDCSTKVLTFWGSPTLVPIAPESTSTRTSTVHSTSTATATVTVTPSVTATAKASAAPSPSTPAANLPTPGVTAFSSPGTYTIPATTLTVSDTTTVCGAATTDLAPGSHNVGAVTTVVSTATTVTCPYATVKTTGSTTTSTIETTTYVCPSAGTWTPFPGNPTSVPSSTQVVYPTPQTITPGTYTNPGTTITATKTGYTYVCPFSDGAASSTSTPAPPAPATSTAAAAPTTTEAPATSSEAPASTSSSSSSLEPQATGALSGKNQYGMTFSPYTTGGKCMDKDEVSKALKTIKNKGFTRVRVYSTECNGLENIGGAAKELGLKLIMGVFIDESGTKGAQSQVDDIAKWAEWSMVDLIVVGNEAISGHGIKADDLASFIKSSAKTFKDAGYSGKVTTTEPINVWQSNKSLCKSVDIVGANLHPFFNKATTAAMAGKFVKDQYDDLKKLCGLEVVNLETGWPSKGNPNGLAIPGTLQQKTAIEGIVKHLGDKSIFFSYADDTWKQPGDLGVEQYWGCSGIF